MNQTKEGYDVKSFDDKLQKNKRRPAFTFGSRGRYKVTECAESWILLGCREHNMIGEDEMLMMSHRKKQ